MDTDFIELALAEAETAALRGEVPVGAVLVSAQGILLAASGNRIVELKDPTAHAEILCIRSGAAKLGSERLIGTSLFITLEPCAMCAGAIAMARINRLVFATDDSKGGAVLNGPRFFEQPTCHHRPDVSHMGGPWGERASALLKDFFRARRA